MKFLLSFIVVIVTIAILPPHLINGAPTSSPQAPEEVNKTLKEGLLVMLAVMKSFDSTRVRVRSSVAEHGICQVVNYITKVTSNDSMSQNETTKFFPSNDALTAAENIRNNTCSWLNSIRANTITTCSNEALELLCTHIKIYKAIKRADMATSTVVDTIDECQWINAHFQEDSPVKERLCHLFQCSK
ncbi:uncharacterized protein LOC135332313 [Halichondria panicea]|uniref:uncharacterized protein LOC135332313 n=1 Tax=Halichondria panicea TaxID=6063 RepID=UPI00312B90FC